MEQPAIFSATLGLSYPWKVTEVTFASADNRLDITVDFDPGSQFVCSCCGRILSSSEGEKEIWHHDSFLRYSTFLHARVPRVECECGHTFPIERPWTRAGSKFAQVH